MTGEGRALSRAKGAGFAAGVWLENDGDAADQEAAHARWRDGMRWGEGRLWHVTGKRAWAAFPGCAPGDLLVSSVPVPRVPDCLWFDPETLAATGAVAFDRPGAPARTAVGRGRRLWHPP